MKKIMFYRRKYRNASSRESAVHSGTLLVLFIMFLSGLLLGSALFYSGTFFSEISRKSAGFLLTRIPIRAGLTGLFFSVITVVCCLFFGLSPFGGVPLATLMHLTVDGVCAANLARYALAEPRLAPILLYFGVYNLVAFGGQWAAGWWLDRRPAHITPAFDRASAEAIARMHG